MKKITMLFTLFTLIFVLSGCNIFNGDDFDDGFIKVDPEKALMIVKNDELYGLVDFEGNEVVSLQHDDIYYCGSYYVASSYFEFTIYDDLGEEIVSMDDANIVESYKEFCPRDYSPLNTEGLIPFESDLGLYGYINFDGEKVIPAQYQTTMPFNDNGLAVVMDDYKTAVINQDGEIVIDFISGYVYQLILDDLIKVYDNGKYGFIDIEGNNVIEFIYDDVNYFIGEYSTVKLDYKQGIIDKSGNIVVDIIYDAIWYNGETEHIIAIKDGKFGYINIEGEIIYSFEYNYIRSLEEDGYLFAEKQGLMGLVDSSENIILDFEYISMFWIDDNHTYLSVKKDDKYALYNKDGDLILGFDYEFIGLMDEDAIIFSTYIDSLEEIKKYGFMDIDGNILLEATYDRIFTQTEGLYLVENSDKYGFINKDGDVVINLDYDNAYLFRDYGLAAVKLNDKWGFINTDGDVVIPIIYDRVYRRH